MAKIQFCEKHLADPKRPRLVVLDAKGRCVRCLSARQKSSYCNYNKFMLYQSARAIEAEERRFGRNQDDFEPWTPTKKV